MEKMIYRWFMLGLLALVATGCFKEDNDNCYTRVARQLVVKTLSKSNRISTECPVGEAKLYVFDSERRFLELKLIDAQTLAEGLPITMDYPDHDTLILVVWGNTDAVNQILSDVKLDNLLDILRLDLQKLGTEIYEPTDIFHGIEYKFAPNYYISVLDPTLTKSGQGAVSEMFISRKVSLVNVILRDMGSEYDPSQFTVRIVNVCTGMDFEGVPLENAVSTIEKKGMSVHGSTASSTLAVLPSEENVIVILDDKGNVVITIDKDENGDDIKINESDKEVNIEIKGHDSNLEVSVTVVPWGTINQDSEFEK